MSWAGKFLRVNLTTGTVTSEPTNMDWARTIRRNLKKGLYNTPLPSAA